MKEKRIEEIREEVNDWDVESLQELASAIQIYADCRAEEEGES